MSSFRGAGGLGGLARATFVVLCAPCLSACDLFDGLANDAQDLAKPATIRLDLPGYRVAEGDFSATRLLHDEDNQIVIATERSVGGEAHLLFFRIDRSVLLDPDTKDPKEAVSMRDLGRVVSYERRYSYVTDTAVRYQLFRDDDGDGIGTSWSVDLEGNTVGGTVEDAIYAKQVLPSYYASKALCDRWELDAKGSLWCVRGDDVSLFAEGVTDVREGEENSLLWTVENGKVIVRNRETSETIDTFGENVMVFEPPIQPNVFVFRDGDTIYRAITQAQEFFVSAEDGELFSSGCSFAGYPASPIWISPCEGGNLFTSSLTAVGSVLGSGPKVKGRIRDYRTYNNALELVVVVPEGAESDELGSLYFIDRSDPANSGFYLIDEHAAFCDRWASEDWEICLRCENGACDHYSGPSSDLTVERLRGAPTGEGVCGYASLGQDGLDFFRDGRLVAWDGESEDFSGATKLDSGYYLKQEVLAHDVIGVRGDPNDPNTSAVTSGVVGFYLIDANGLVDGPENWQAFVRGKPGDSAGSLYVLHQTGTRVLPEGLIDTNARNVVPASLVAISHPPTVIARSPDSTDLRAIYVEAQDEETIPGPITEYFPGSSQPGLYYVVSEGSRKGLWFAPPK